MGCFVNGGQSEGPFRAWDLPGKKLRMENNSGLESKTERSAAAESLVLEDLSEIFWLDLRPMEVTCPSSVRGGNPRSRTQLW